MTSWYNIENQGAKMITIDETSEYYSVKAAAKVLKKHERTILRWCKNGTIAAVRVGAEWRISKPIQVKGS